MATHFFLSSSPSPPLALPNNRISKTGFEPRYSSIQSSNIYFTKRFRIWCSNEPIIQTLRTCKNCKTQFNLLLNHPRACLYHTSHYGGETRRKFESVHSGGTMNTPDSGKISQYWHCCGSEDPFDLGCTAAPHSSYDE